MKYGRRGGKGGRLRRSHLVFFFQPPLLHTQAIALINEAKTILTDDVANWKLMFSGAAADYTVGPAANATSPQCSGPTCARIAAMLPLLAFKAKKAVVRCPLDQFQAGACFAPGCAPCDAACPIFAAQPFLLTLPGPFGNGIYCNGRCTPCCQAADNPGRALNSTCVIV
jgi:hypothetical protein